MSVVADTVMLAVMSAYSSTMLKVQAWELGLAGLVFCVERAEPLNTPPDTQEVMTDMWRLVQTASPGEFRRRLKGRLEPALEQEIKDLIEWRNFLAHRYLRTRLYTGGDGLAAEPRMFTELHALGRAFDDSTEPIQVAANQAIASTKPGALPESESGATYEQLLGDASRLLLVQPQYFDGTVGPPLYG